MAMPARRVRLGPVVVLVVGAFCVESAGLLILEELVVLVSQKGTVA
jgi:hypothetical protein